VPTPFDIEVPDGFTVNEHGIWCDGCGELIAPEFHIDDDYVCPSQCKRCGWPDEFDPVEAGFVDGDEEE